MSWILLARRKGIWSNAAWAVGLTIVPVGTRAQPVPSTFTGVPAQVIPVFQEQGAPTFTTPSGSGSFSGLQGTGTAGGGDPGVSSGNSTGSGDVYNRMMAQPYGASALQTSQQLGLNPNAMAAFGQLESGFRNVDTSNGTSSATGPWQVTSGTWNDYVSRYNLPYTSADRTNPEAQAVVSNYILQDYANKVSSSINQPATIQQAYGAWVYGPDPGSRMAKADPSEPMSSYVSARNLSNNNMTGWSVGQFYAHVESKVGSIATQTVRAGGSPTG